MSVEPPFDTGAVHDRSMLLSRTVAARLSGAPGTVAGVMPLLVPDAVLVPRAFVAVTVNV